MHILILTEKPSVAQDIVRVFKNPVRKDGYFLAEGGDIFPGKRVIVTWAFGHLLELREPGDYRAEWKAWSLEKLPVFPSSMQYSPVKKTRKQLETIRKLFREKKIDFVVLATDADREGHTLGMLILRHVGWKGKTLRFWTSEALTPRVVRRVLKEELRPNEEFDSLFLEGLARQHADWLYGINLTRAMTVAFGSQRERGRAGVLSIGRCQTAVLAILAEREKAIREFKPEPYWLIRARTEKGPAFLTDGPGLAKCKRFELGEEGEKSKIFRFAHKSSAEKVFAKVKQEYAQKQGLKVEKCEVKARKVSPPLLFSLSELQAEANRYLGFSAAKTLATAQSLYDKHKVITYPRTSCPYVAGSNVDKLIATLRLLGIENAGEKVRSAYSRLVNDRKVAEASHHAILVERLQSVRGEDFTEDERKLFELIQARIRAAVAEPAVYQRVTAELSLGDYRFYLTEETLVEPGWKRFYPPGVLVSVGKPKVWRTGEIISAELSLDRKITEPPPRYTEGSLISAMKNAWRFVKDETLAHVLKTARGIGTDATRDQLIETLKARRYVFSKGRSLQVSERGLDVYSAARKLNLMASDPGMTALWEKVLSEIGAGRKTYREFVESVKNRVKEEVERIKAEAGNIRIKGAELLGTGKKRALWGRRKKKRFRKTEEAGSSLEP